MMMVTPRAGTGCGHGYGFSHQLMPPSIAPCIRTWPLFFMSHFVPKCMEGVRLAIRYCIQSAFNCGVPGTTSWHHKLAAGATYVHGWGKPATCVSHLLARVTEMYRNTAKTQQSHLKVRWTGSLKTCMAIITSACASKHLEAAAHMCQFC